MEEKVYIKFNDPKPSEPLPPDGPIKKAIKNIVIKILTTIIPGANPDFEHLLDSVEYWKIEYNTQKHCTWREIGFDKDGNSTVAMPFGDNYGYWIDNNLTLEDYKQLGSTLISADEFESDWKDFENRMNIIHKNQSRLA